MGLFDAITGSVIMKYKVETDQAKAKIKELSGEQKKAAKEAAEALEKQGKAAESMASQYAKGAAIIAGAYVLARDGVKQMRNEARLSAGAAGVDIDRLSDSWDGLKTRMDLLTLAQAGHRGAWKLTTEQIAQVSEGMRALEKKGYDTTAVFDKFTDVMKKGKLEGLDDFGLSLKATGDQSKDLQVLLGALRGEVRQVGGDFSMAGDDVVRATVKMEDGINRVRITIGKLTTEIIQAASDLGENFGRMFGGNLSDEQSYQFNARDQYAANFARRRSGQGLVANGSISTAAAFLGGGAQDVDFVAADALGRFRQQVRQAGIGRGPLASIGAADFQDVLSQLPQGWREVDPVLAAMAENLKDRLDVRMQTVGVDAVKSMWRGFRTELEKNAAAMRASQRPGRGGRGGRGAAPADDWLSGALDSALGTASAFGGYLGDVGAANQNAARQDEILQQRFAAAMEQNRRFAAEMEQQQAAKEQSFLERTFGKLEEFDRYGAAFATLKGAVTSGFNAWIAGAESVGTAVRRSIAQSLGGYAIEMAGMALVAAAHGVYHLTNPLTAAQGAGELLSAAKYTAAAAALGGLAKLASPSGNGVPATGGSATGGRAGRNQDHRGANDGSGARTVGQSTVIVLGSDYGDDSRRVRERNAYAAFSRTATVYQPPRGAAA